MFKYLRIAVTVLSLTACVLLIALWVRSYTWNDVLSRQEINGASATLGSNDGRVYVGQGNFGPPPGANPKTLPRTNFFTAEASPPGWQSRSGFEWHSDATVYVVYCPYWFLVFIAVGVAAAPWISRRFSLRTLLIATALFAVGMGIVVAVQ